MSENITFTVFTKLLNKPLPELGRYVKDLGLDGVELPVRPGYPVDPDNISSALPEAGKIFADFGLKIGSVAGSIDEKTIAACSEVGIPIIRICVLIHKDMDYWKSIELHQKQWDKLIPALDKYGVSIGIQNHCDRCIANTAQMHSVLQNYDPKHICAV
jgi:sugar phosphate isomerase/epimerase